MFYCKYCGKECKNRNSLAQHELRCPQNPNRLNCSYPGHTAWNKGLTADIDNRVKKYSETLKNYVKQAHSLGNKYSTGVAKTHDKEIIRREKISNSMKNNPKAGGYRPGSGYGKQGWYKGIHCDSTYELVYVIYCLDHNINIKRCKRNYKYDFCGKIHTYYPDFELEDGTLIEIKGFMREKDYYKIASVNDRKLNVLFYNDLDYMFEYVENTYKYAVLEELYET
ncbi:MAG: hypothetical protein IJZ79_01615 [Bacilli bacterium]|nr:hypothetical protein [Bacilli bacterium]